MKKHNLFLIIVLVVLMASIMTPIVTAQWKEAFPLTSQMNGFYFTDSLHGWFTHESLARIIHTSDGGYTFTIQPTPNGTYGLRDIYMESNQIGWAGGDNNGGPGRVLRTTNGGATWVNMVHPAPNSGWLALAKGGNTMWFVGGYGPNNMIQGIIMKTSNNGASWQVNLYPEFGTLIDIKVLDEQNVLICGKQAIHRTTDAGVTWLPVFIHSNPDFWFSRLAFVNDTLGYALGNIAMTGKTYLYRTTDAGFTWNEHYYFDDVSHQKVALSVIPSTGTIFVAGYKYINQPGDMAILKSTNGGTTWDFFPTNYLIDHLYTPTPYQGWAGAGSMIYRYDYVEPPVVQPIPNALIQLGEAFQYQVQATGMGLKYFMSGHPAGLNIGQYSGLIQGTPSPGGNFALTVAVKDTDFNVVNAQFNLRVNRKPLFIPPFPQTSCWVDSFYNATISANDIDDDTLTFSALQLSSFLQLIQNPPLPAAYLQGTPAITDTGYHNVSIMVSDDYGGSDTLNFSLRVRGYNNPPQFIGSWMDTINIFKDSVYSWHLDFEDTDGDTIYTIAGNIGVPGIMLLPGSGAGVVTAIVTGAPSDTGTYQASVSVKDEFGLIGTLEFTVIVDIVTGVKPEEKLPAEFILYQNYPNPFNPTTKIRYSLPAFTLRQAQGDIWVTLKVYDILGNELATLVDEYKPAGSYEVKFSASELASGIYFYRLSAGQYSDMKKLILLR